MAATRRLSRVARRNPDAKRRSGGERARSDDRGERSSFTFRNQILRLQEAAGNQAVRRLLIQRQSGGDKQKSSERIPEVVATLTIGGNTVEGGSRVPGHEGTIELRSISIEAGKEKGSFRIRLSKPLDVTSAELRKAFIQASKVDTARFEYLRRGEGGVIETYRSFEFKEGLVAGLQIGGGDEPIEVVELNMSGGS